MTAWLIRRFVKDYENTENGEVRAAYGTLGSCVGILVNLLLSAGKFLIGLLSGSVAILADAANNLSDAAGSIVALVSTRVARKPVDAEHPFGHGRMEYLSALGVAALIMAAGFELFLSAVDKIRHPALPEFGVLTIVVLALAIAVKLWMALFYKKIGNTIRSEALKASCADSRNDVICTGVVLLTSLIGWLSGVAIDGYVGLLVALFVIWSGFTVIKETVSPLLGQAPDPEMVRGIRETVLAHDGVVGVHDLMVHNYGPGKIFASAHIEMDAAGDVMTNHDIIDNIERQVKHSLRIEFVAHMDPIKTNDPQVNKTKTAISEAFSKMDGLESIHDFRIVPGPSHTNVIFDVVLSHNCILTENDIRSIAKRALDELGDGHTYYPVITFDKMYTHLGNEENL